MLGVDHIGVGTRDMRRSSSFYADLGFTEVAFDYSGPLPGMERVAGREIHRARVVHIRSARPTALGLGAIKLVQVLDSEVPGLPEGAAFGEIGICEVCVHTRGQPRLYRWLVEERSVPGLMEPTGSMTSPHQAEGRISYVSDPFGGKVELNEWLNLQEGWPVAEGFQGVNHVAFGVSDIERSRDFYARLGFAEMLFESNGYFRPMDAWYSGAPPKQHMMLLTNPHGAAVEPVEQDPPSPDMRGDWGHVGPMDFGIGVRNIDKAVRHLRDDGFTFLSEPQEIATTDGAWRYAYLVEPDGLFVCLTEARY